jgi:hypothetical protein
MKPLPVELARTRRDLSQYFGNHFVHSAVKTLVSVSRESRTHEINSSFDLVKYLISQLSSTAEAKSAPSHILPHSHSLTVHFFFVHRVILPFLIKLCLLVFHTQFKPLPIVCLTTGETVLLPGLAP